ncbi:MAG: hypothetical protein HY322_14310 [Betaproteobacteria bacterium]|nr:hypothetical protein [Betaproteobacteria bacterium]
MHNNLLLQRDKKGAYEQLQRDLKWDITKANVAWGLAFWCLVIAAMKGVTDGWLWLVAGVALLMMCSRWFLEASNRNYLMHVIDWLEATGNSKED